MHDDELLDIEDLATNVAVTRLSLTIDALRSKLPGASDSTLEKVQAHLNETARSLIAANEGRQEGEVPFPLPNGTKVRCRTDHVVGTVCGHDAERGKYKVDYPDIDVWCYESDDLSGIEVWNG